MKTKILFIILFMSTQASYALDKECNPQDVIDQFSGEVLRTVAPLKVCPTLDEILSKQVNEEYEKFYGKAPQVTKEVKGFKLSGSAEELKLANSLLGAKPPKDWVVAATGCSTIICAFKNLFKSEDAAKQFFNIPAKSGYSLNLDQTINSKLADQHWSAAEIKEMDAAISKLPPALKRLPHVTVIDRLGDNLRRHGHTTGVAAYASPHYPGMRAELVTYENTYDRKATGNPYEVSSWPQEVIVHELCHHHDFKGIYSSHYGNISSYQKDSAFRKLSDWKDDVTKKGEANWVHGAKSQFISSYAKTNPAEDYAETCMNYLLHPKALEKAAPDKYAFMKQYVFNNAEFKNEVWVKGKNVPWPKLDQLMTDETGCKELITSCGKNLVYGYNTWAIPGPRVTEYSSDATVQSEIKKSECFSKFKNEKMQTAESLLMPEEDYCKNGGLRTIKDKAFHLCKSDLDQFAKLMNQAIKTDTKDVVADCEAANDYTSECVLAKFPILADAPLEYREKMKSILMLKVPDRMVTLGNKLNSIPTVKWLKACLSSISEIDIFNIKKGDGVQSLYSYKSSSPGYSSAYLGQYIFDDRKDANRSCSEKILELYKTNGMKVPESGTIANLLQRPFKDEFSKFESEVVAKIKPAIKDCQLKECKRKAVSEILSSWEAQAPDKRAGIVDEQLIDDLIKKTYDYTVN